eukprot:jgi/Chlat1/2475/Chrsp175S08711
MAGRRRWKLLADLVQEKKSSTVGNEEVTRRPVAGYGLIQSTVLDQSAGKEELDDEKVVEYQLPLSDCGDKCVKLTIRQRAEGTVRWNDVVRSIDIDSTGVACKRYCSHINSRQ